ncbi:hypothetical protein DFP72DRAFT_922467 [Ephemerocybe angulata]|uniref:Uncharacterized protein n=1 Tax=Ephemerocybe angulata TaxID=980116 RepID=A0A8H6HGJ8_9AGAR|nr:hypothetical protein DFP72DRAFT_922467 [Tulosesus angulatus]
MLFKKLAPALSLLLVASTKLVKASPLQARTGTAADVYQYVECTFTVQEIGDKPYTFPPENYAPPWQISDYIYLITAFALAESSPGHGSYGREGPVATRDEANRSWIYRDAQVGAGFTLAETQTVLEAMPGRVEIGLGYAWLIKDVKDCVFAERVGITPPRYTAARGQ